MCRKVICAQVLKVGTRPSSKGGYGGIVSLCAEGIA